MRLLLLLLVFLCMHTCLAQQQQELAYDTAHLQQRHFEEKKMDGYKADRDFQYNRYKEPPASLWDRFWDWFWEKIAQIMSTREGAITFKTVMIILAVLVLGFFIYRLTGMSKAGLFGRTTGENIGYTVSDEDIHGINFEQAIEQAVQNGNYRLAVRMLYLQTLKMLTDRNLINWQVNKTNITYLQELQGSAYQQPFNHLTWQFESNWYGDMPIDAGEFNQVRDQFNQFNRQIQ